MKRREKLLNLELEYYKLWVMIFSGIFSPTLADFLEYRVEEERNK